MVEILGPWVSFSCLCSLDDCVRRTHVALLCKNNTNDLSTRSLLLFQELQMNLWDEPNNHVYGVPTNKKHVATSSWNQPRSGSLFPNCVAESQGCTLLWRWARRFCAGTVSRLCVQDNASTVVPQRGNWNLWGRTLAGTQYLSSLNANTTLGGAERIEPLHELAQFAPTTWWYGWWRH